MNCPSCGTPDAYQGLMGISCKNSSCKHGGGGTGETDDASASPGVLPSKSALPRGLPSAFNSKVKTGLASSGWGSLPAPHGVLGAPYVPPVKSPIPPIPSTYTKGTFHSRYNHAALVLLNKATINNAGLSVKGTNQVWLTIDLLNDFKNYVEIEDALVAGGAPRNWYNKTDANDIDVFIVENAGANLIQKWINSGTNSHIINAAPAITAGKQNTKYPTTAINYIIDFSYCTTSVEIKFQVISINKTYLVMKGLSDLYAFIMETFDYNICKCFFEDEVLWISKEAYNDFNNSLLTFSLSKNILYERHHKLHERFVKLSSYYPGFILNMEP